MKPTVKIIRNNTIDQKPKNVILFSVNAQGNKKETSRSKMINKINIYNFPIDPKMINKIATR